MKMKRIILCFIFMFIFILPVSAEEADIYSEQYEISGAGELEDALPDSTREYFSEIGIDPKDPDWIDSISGENVFKHIWEFIKTGAKTPLRAGAAILGIILITAAFSAVNEESSVMTAAMYACTLTAAAVIGIPIFESITAAVNATKALSVFMLSFIPLFAAVAAASGAAVTSVSMNSLLLLCAQGLSFLSSFVVLPLMGGYLAVGISSSVSPLLNRSGLAEGIKKIALWVLSFISMIFVGILSLQTAVNSAADSLAMRTAKFILGSTVPIAGGALSEAVSTVTASMGLLKSSVGIYGVVAVSAIFLPIIIELLLWRIILTVCSFVSELFSVPKFSNTLKAVDMMLSVLIGIVLLSSAVFIISLTVVVTFTKAS